MESVCTEESSVVNKGSMEIKEDDDDDKEEEKEKQDVYGSETKVLVNKKSWEPSVLATIGKEIHHFAGHDISIWESLDSYGSVIWPAALALCHYLESNHDTVNLLDKAVLEIGAGTGLVSIVASLLGAWVTATDLPEVLSNLRCNLSRNTRGHCRYTPQVAELSWGYGLDKSFPHSVYRYDYVLAADVVYHHDFLAELLVTMRHFCQLGTTLIWANKVRFESDLVFTENFKKAFNTTLLEDNGEVKIYAATTKEGDGPVVSEVMKEAVREEEGEAEMIVEKEMKSEELKEQKMVEHEEVRGQKEFVEVFGDDGKQNVERNSQFREDLVTRHTDMGKQVEASKVEEGNLNDNKDEDQDNRSCETEESENEESCSDRDSADETFIKQNEECSTETNKQDFMRLWAPTIYYRPTKEMYHFLDQEIKIQESIDYYGALIWPAGVAACRFLETPQGRQQFNFLDKSVLELGAGTGLLSVVVTLLGAKLTTTDLPEILSNLTCNINRNTRGRRRHEPLITELLWGHKLEETFPKSHYYDYVLATDVVYHHDYLAELLATMNYFCQPGTTLIWANKVRSASDLVFIEDFHRTFNTTLLTVIDDVRIYVATTKLSEEEAYLVTEMSEEEEVEERVKVEEHDKHVVEDDAPDFGEYIKHDQDYQDLEQNAGETSPVGEKGEGSNPEEKNIIVEATLVELECDQTQSSETDSDEKQAHEDVQDCEVSQQEDEEILAEPDNTGTNEHSVYQRSWAPTVYYKLCKEIYNFVGHEITIQESIDSYGGMIWPGALALCRFLETPAGQQQINLLDKSTLEIGAGTGLVSIVATLLGAKLTATDLPEVLGNLRCNLNRNTRWHRRHEPQVEALSWGHRLEETFPQSTHHYDYILAADVVYHHDFLAELLTTMCQFCQTGTTLIWANKVRYASDLVFIENFKKAFDTTLLTELDEVRIYSATMRESEDDNAQEDDQEKRVEEPDPLSSDKQSKPNRKLERREGSLERTVVQDPVGIKIESDDEGDHTSDEKNLWNHHKRTKDGRENKENDIQTRDQNDGNYTAKVRNEAVKELDEENANDELTSSDNKAKSDNTKTVMLAQQESTEPKMNTKLCSERYFFAGYEIVINDTLEPYRLKERPAALALCKFLEADPLPLSFKSKAVLELGAGSGLVSIVASLLGAWVTATDKPAVIDNLSSNLFRNTKGRSKHKPQVEALFWNKNLIQTFPRSIYHYDIVLAADVVYQHNYLDDLLATMRHFCQPGTTLIWANRMCSQTDVNFTQRFKKAFQSTLLAEMEEVKIFMALPHIQQFV